MKIAELIQEYEGSLRENAEAALRSADWNYDVDPCDAKRFRLGRAQMAEVQDSLKKLHSRSPDVATDLWMQHCPYARGSLPAWVLK